MSSTPQHHEQLKTLLAEGHYDAAQALWLDLASQLSDQPEFLLLLVKEFADANQTDTAAELAALLAPNLKDAGKPREWLFALKLQAAIKYPPAELRPELIAAYTQIHTGDARLKAILNAAGLDQPRTPLSTALAKTDTLFALAVGAHCQHKSWGFGIIKTFDTALNRIIVTFPHNPDHALQLPYAADSLTPINHDHIEVRKQSDLDNLKTIAASDPVALLRIVLLSHNRSATPGQIENSLTGTVITADKWKKWWDNTKRLAKRDPHFVLPAKKTDPILLLAAPVSQQDELLEAFNDAPGLSQKTDVARKLLKIADDLDNPDLLLQEFHDSLHTAITTTPAGLSAKPAERLQAAFLLEDLLAHQRIPAGHSTPLVSEFLSTAINLPALLDQLNGAGQKRAIAHLKQNRPATLLDNLNRLDAKLLDEIADLLAEPGTAARIRQHVQNQTAGLELLLWLCRTVTATKPPAWITQISGPALLSAILNAIEASHYRSVTKRLRDQLLSDDTLITELLAGVSPAVIRDHARALLASTAFDELDRRSLMARLVKEFPFVQDLLIVKTVKEQPLIVSRASFIKRQAELDELIQKKIPENSKEIGVARSYGDLRENFEFKAAKDMQKLLMRRRAELEVMLSRATPTDFADTGTDTVQPGATVTVTELPAGKTLTYHILGAWDGNPACDILSYPAALAQALINKRPGDEVEFTGETGPQHLRIERIEKTPAGILQRL